MNAGRTYKTPAAFRRALTDRLRDLANTSPWSLAQLQRQFAYDRLLERLYLVDEGWIVKGAAALIARNLGVRGTIDIDLYRAVAVEEAEAELRQAARRDIGDWFRFEVGPGQTMFAGAVGVRLPVTAMVGVTVWCEFHVDLVGAEIRLTGQPDRVPALARVAIPEVEQRGYVVYPLVDHIADKMAAILQTYGTGQVLSTRYKDLVDLVAIVPEASVDATQQRDALTSEAERRGIVLPAAFSVPDRESWEKGYAAEASRSLLTTALTLDDALAVVTPFLDPVLDGTAAGKWHPKTRSWS